MSDTNRNHLTWSVEEPDGKCGTCGEKTILLISPGWWTRDGKGEDFQVSDEVSGHYCRNCERLRSLSLNTQQNREAK